MDNSGGKRTKFTSNVIHQDQILHGNGWRGGWLCRHLTLLNHTLQENQGKIERNSILNVATIDREQVDLEADVSKITMSVDGKKSSHKSKLDKISSQSDRMTENSFTKKPSCLDGGSECGTKISVSSALDSPNKNKVYGGKLEHESELVGELTFGHNGTIDNASNSKSIDAEVVAIDSSEVKQHPDGSESDVPNQLKNVTDPQTWKSSPNRSPEIHITALEAYGTPSSKVSVKAKRNKVDKSGPTKR
ncbi:hypothetical protein GIB67_015454 [Kingdonia uniflora]|uniref:Uncharacterized protein n=1 Tax=Kingdonia uniflora TaxID=39325 RepID=A0A7J7KYZ5_9MAGN|nr:hypothetical protein GIB67_015454 [Kingdonia uniflora]